MASTEASSRSRRLRVAAALTAAACAVGLTAVVVRQDVSSIGSALAQYTSIGPGGAVSAESPVHWQQLQVCSCPRIYPTMSPVVTATPCARAPCGPPCSHPCSQPVN